MRISISDDDLCSDCQRCDYHPGDSSGCDLDFPTTPAPDDSPRAGYIVVCDFFQQVTK